QFRSTGLLGCPACYAAFESKLGPVLERAHEGAARHVGKAPRRALAKVRSAGDRRAPEAILGDVEQPARPIGQPRDQLEVAIKAEQYERAAAIRDDLRRMTEGDAEPIGEEGDARPGAAGGSRNTAEGDGAEPRAAASLRAAPRHPSQRPARRSQRGDATLRMWSVQACA